MNIPNPPAELFYKFNDIEYHDKPHKYYLYNKPLTSVTTLIHKYEEEFDDKWYSIKADEYGVSEEDIRYAWKFINERGTTKGSIIHDYTENLFLNKVFPYPKDEIIKKFGYDAIWDEFVITKKHVDKFYNDSKNKLIPIKTELVCYDIEHMISGMVDMLFYNVKAKEFQIWDWKTNNKFTTSSDYYLKYPLNNIMASNLDIYSLQLSTYKYIINKHININLGNSYIVRFSAKDKNYEVLKTHDYTKEVERMLNDFSIKK